MDNMWEFRPGVSSGSYNTPAMWIELPTTSTKTIEITLRDTTMTDGQFTSRILQVMRFTGMGREPIEVSGVTYNGARVKNELITTGFINGEKFSESTSETQTVYIPKLAFFGYQRTNMPFNSGYVEMRMTKADLK